MVKDGMNIYGWYILFVIINLCLFLLSLLCVFLSNFIGREGLALDLLVFPELLQQVACVDRVLSVPRGSLLLAGRSGVGRKSSVRIVSALHSKKLLTPKVGRNYSLNSFKIDLKQVLSLLNFISVGFIFLLLFLKLLLLRPCNVLVLMVKKSFYF